MRQHISIEQWNELSEKGKETLKKWGKKYGLDEICGECHYGNEWWGNKINPLSIGQLIEFLDENNILAVDENALLLLPVVRDNSKGGLRENICDALWEAVKEILETKEERGS